MDTKSMWDYRVIRKTEHGEEWLSIQEVYYDDDTPMAQSIDLQVEGVTIEEMKTQLELMLKSLNQPVLDESDIVDVSDTETETIGRDGHGNDLYIYESPDNGKTIFRRKTGETEREEIEKGL